MDDAIGVLPLDEIGVLPLDELVEHRRMVETGNAAGVRSVDTLAPRGSYHRQPARAMDTAGLDPDQQELVRDITRSLDQPYGFARALTLKDARIAGQGSVVTRDHWLLRESAAEFLAHGATPDGFAREGERLLLPQPSRRIDAPVLLLKRPWWRNYGHWLVDSAAALALAIARLRLPAGWHVVVGRQENAAMRRVVADTLACLAPGVKVLEHPDDEVWACSELLYMSPLHIPPLTKHPEGLSSLRALMLRAAPIAPHPGRRLFVSRGGHGARRLDNEAELVAHARSRGYELVDPQQYDLAAQVALFHGADCVVGVKGAALANLAFCAAGAACLVLSPGDFPDPFFWDLASHGGVAYSELFGRLTSRDRARSHNSFAIDPDRFAALLPG